MDKTLYTTLHLSKDADGEMIETAYRLKISKLKDRTDDEAKIELQSVKWAYETLSNPKKRAEYDNKLSYQQASASYSYVDSSESEGLLSQGNLLKLFVMSLILFGIYLYWNHKNEADKNSIVNNAVSGTLVNQSRVIDTVSDLGNQEIASRNAQLQAQIDADARRALLIRVQQDSQADYQREQLELQKERQDAQIAQQQNQMDMQKKMLDQQRADREKRYYACVNSTIGTKINSSAACGAYR
ncbi:MAG: J domain-containing protein [Methylophilaceae bacterium]